MNNINIKKQRMIFSILLGGCLLLLSSIILQNKLEKEIQDEMTLQEKRAMYMMGKVKKTPWDISISSNIQPVLKSTIKYNVSELLFISQPNWSKQVKKIKLNIGLESELSNLSNGNPLNCEISLAVRDKNYFTEEDVKEFNFILLHEVAHCFVGKSVLTRDVMDWVGLNEDEKLKVNALFKKQEYLFLKSYCKTCNEKYGVPSPAIVYHELLADGIAASWLLMLDTQLVDMESIYKKRTIDFIKNPLKSEHPSHFVLKEIEEEFKRNRKLTYEVIIKIAQKSLIEYLQEMQFHYAKLNLENKIDKEEEKL